MTARLTGGQRRRCRPAGDKFTKGWAGNAFNKMLDNHVGGHPLEGKPPKDDEKA